MFKKAVIGLGNILRRDDGVGISVLDGLLASHKKEGVDYLDFGVASFDLLHRLRQYDKALLIDGIDAGLAFGKLKIFELGKIKNFLKNSPISSHELGLKELATLCKKFGIKTKIYVAGIQVKDVSFGEGMTKELKDKKEGIVKEIARFIDEYDS